MAFYTTPAKSWYVIDAVLTDHRCNVCGKSVVKNLKIKLIGCAMDLFYDNSLNA